MGMKPQQDIRYLLKIQEHAETELDLGINPDSRIWNFLWTKSDEAKQATKDKLLKYLQTPPDKLPNESDEEYIQRFYAWSEEAGKQEALLKYIK